MEEKEIYGAKCNLYNEIISFYERKYDNMLTEHDYLYKTEQYDGLVEYQSNERFLMYMIRDLMKKRDYYIRSEKGLMNPENSCSSCTSCKDFPCRDNNWRYVCKDGIDCEDGSVCSKFSKSR